MKEYADFLGSQPPYDSLGSDDLRRLVEALEVEYVAAGSMSIVFSFAIFALELLVAALQAYIFTVLSAQYISSAIAEEH